MPSRVPSADKTGPVIAPSAVAKTGLLDPFELIIKAITLPCVPTR